MTVGLDLATIIILSNILSFLGAVVGLEDTSLTLSEDAGVIEICAAISSPDTLCPVEYPFEIMLETLSGTAGKVVYCPNNPRLILSLCSWQHGLYCS